MKVASHSVGAGLPPNRAASRAQPFRAPVCNGLRTSVGCARTSKPCLFETRQTPGTATRTWSPPPGRTTERCSERNVRFKRVPRVIQQRASNQPSHPRLTTTGDGLKRAGDRRGTREFQQFRSDPQPPRLTKAGDAHKALCRRSTDQREPPPATRASARAVPAPSARTKQGANRMTGPTTRDSAQLQPSDKHRWNASHYLHHIAASLSPNPNGVPPRIAMLASGTPPAKLWAWWG